MCFDLFDLVWITSGFGYLFVVMYLFYFSWLLDLWLQVAPASLGGLFRFLCECSGGSLSLDSF